MGTPYLGKLTKEEKQFFSQRKEGKTIHKDDRIKPDKDPGKTGKKSG